jgi:hypothetical protein
MPGRTVPVTGAAPGDGIGVCGMVQAPVSGSQAASVSAVSERGHVLLETGGLGLLAAELSRRPVRHAVRGTAAAAGHAKLKTHTWVA